MISVFNRLVSMRKRNATHRRGVRMKDMTPEMLIERAREELQELEDSPDDPYEMADVLAILTHYSILKGWLPDYMENCIHEKLDTRFD